MEIANYRPSTANEKIIADFDIVDVPMTLDGLKIYKGAYRNYQVRRNGATKAPFVSSKWAYMEQSADPSDKPIHHNFVEMPPEMRKEFNAIITKLLIPYCAELSKGPEQLPF